MPHGSLTLPARLHLLAWDTATGEAAGAAPLVRAGALTELAQRGLLLDDDGIATPADLDALTGDPVLDGLLELVRESRPHRWRDWVTLHARVTADAVRQQLTADGYLGTERRRVLGVFPAADHVLRRADVVEALREEARRTLAGPLTAVSAREAAATALAVAAALPTPVAPVGGDGHAESCRRRVDELAERSGVAGIVRELCAALRTTAVAAAGR
ncbi:GOLPH3/VPS74 family protein [Streptomyces sp. H51]|uniref:GOLPH3/VPS74 family protein n=1 Tax=Streptomyces sp. H51 TaxID=3111770 RepID=UPI002D76DD04|nr:GPP34 family phosphoprotein [Streptomyces sp. H51]